MRTKGFTILELIVVLLVLGIIIGIAIPNIKGMQQNTNITKASKEIATIETALEMYRTSTSSYPIATTPITNLQQQYLINATPRIISAVLYDPFAATSTTEYSYMSSPNGKYYVIWSVSLSGAVQPSAISNSGVISY
jgi:general secretion pathway protein G